MDGTVRVYDSEKFALVAVLEGPAAELEVRYLWYFACGSLLCFFVYLFIGEGK